MFRPALLSLCLILTPLAAPAQEVEPPMTPERLAGILLVLDPEAAIAAPSISLTIENVPVRVVMDPGADRMRILVPIASSTDLDAAALRRLMQANFDTALDARYAIANERLWSTFIHPLSPLETDQLLSGLAQTVTLALTYGDSFSSGAIQFGGGDSGDLLRQLRELGEEL